jgi:hypothetical protein
MGRLRSSIGQYVGQNFLGTIGRLQPVHDIGRARGR